MGKLLLYLEQLGFIICILRIIIELNQASWERDVCYYYF